MRITALDVRQQQFTTRMFRGFDVQEVDAFLQDVAEDYGAVLNENALLKEQLAALEERSRGFEEMEKTMREMLVACQRMTDEVRANAQREAQLLLDDAHLRCEKLLDETRAEEAKIKAEVQTLKRVRVELAEGIRATVGRFQRMADAEAKDAAAE